MTATRLRSLVVVVLLAACGGTASPIAATTVADPASGMFSAPEDAVPSSDGKTVYFVAKNAAGMPAVLSASGGMIATVHAGAPLMDPRGIAISTDDKTLYVADNAAGILVVPADPKTGSPYVLVLGSYGPTGIDLVSENGADEVYFAAVAQSVPQVMKVSATAGAAPMRLASRDPLAAPTGIAVTGGNAFVGNLATAGAAGMGNVVKVSGTTGTVLADKLDLGDPAGAALTPDGATLLVSAMTANHAALYTVDVASGKATLQTGALDAHLGAGGMHRAHTASVYAWADPKGGVLTLTYSP